MVMPDERARGEPDLPSARLQPPADIHIVARPQVQRIEAADRHERLAPKRHVAAGHVLGNPVVQQHVCWAARCARDRLRHRWIVGGHDVRSSGSDDVRGQERLNEECQPVRVDPRVRVGVGHDLAGRVGEPDVASRAEAGVGRVDDADARVSMSDRARAIPRAVVDQNDLVVGIGEPFERREAVLDRGFGVVRADDNRHARPRSPGFGWEGRVGECRRHGSGGRLGPALAGDEPERPVVHAVAATPPFVGPAKRDRSAAAFFECDANVGRGDGRLSRVTFADTVRTGFGDEQRLVSSDVLQPRQVRAQLRLTVQVQVEGAHVEERQIEKFSRREVDVGEQAVG